MRVAFSVISDSVLFLRKYYSLLVFSLVILSLNQLAIWGATEQTIVIKYLAEIISLLFSVLVEIAVSLFIYQVIGVLPKNSTLFDNIKTYFFRALVVFILGGLLATLSAILFGFPFICLFSFLSVEFPNFFTWIWAFIYLFLWLGFVSLGIRIMVLRKESGWNLIKLGLRELNRNLHFYFQVYLCSVIFYFAVDFLIFLMLIFLSSLDNITLLSTAHRLSAAINLPLANVIITLAFLRKNFGENEIHKTFLFLNNQS